MSACLSRGVGARRREHDGYGGERRRGQRHSGADAGTPRQREESHQGEIGGFGTVLKGRGSYRQVFDRYPGGDTMPRRAFISALALAATASLLAGCGGGSSGGSGSGTNNNSGPAGELTSAIDALSNASTVDATVKIGATASQLLTFVKQHDPSSKMTASQANALAGAQLAFEATAPSGKTLGQSGTNGGGAADISISDNGSPLFTLRVVNKTLYFQVAVKNLLDTLGKSSTYAQIQSAAGQLPSFIQALLRGGWVSLPESTAKSLSSQLGGSQSSGSSSQGNAVLNALKSLLSKDVTVTRTSSGGTDVLTISGNARTLTSDFMSAVTSNVPAAGAALGSTNPSSVPSKTISLTATVTGGALSSLSIDLGQFTKTGKPSLPLQLAISKSGPSISAPSGATPIDTNELGQLLGSFSGGGL